MSDLHSVPEVLSYLKKIPSYEKALGDRDETHLHRGAAEALVKQSLYYDFGKLYRFADLEQRVFLDDYFMRYEVIFLKNVLRYLLDSQEDLAEIDLSAYRAVFERHSLMDPHVLMGAESVEGLIGLLQDTPYGKALAMVNKAGGANLFDYEAALDMLFFKQLWQDVKKHLKKQDLMVIQRSAGLEADTPEYAVDKPGQEILPYGSCGYLCISDSHPLPAFHRSGQAAGGGGKYQGIYGCPGGYRLWQVP